MASGPVNEQQNQQHAVYIPDTSRNQSLPQRTNTPRTDLLDVSRRKEYLERCVPLYEASIKGDWKTAEVILDNHPDMVRFSITENYDTALHIAASTKDLQFVENLVNLMERKDLELQNANGNTALSLAAAAGTVQIAKIMVEKNKSPPTTPNSAGMLPLYMAALFGRHGMVKYLYGESHKLMDDCWTPERRKWLLHECVETDIFDVALDILHDHPTVDQDGGALHVLARKPAAFTVSKQRFIWRIINSLNILKVEHVEKEEQALSIVRIIWKNVIQDSPTRISDIIRGPVKVIEEKVEHSASTIEDMIRRLCMLVENNGVQNSASAIGDVIKAAFSEPVRKASYPNRMLFVAAETGNAKFLIELIHLYPDLIWKKDDDGRTIFHSAVLNRQENVYNLLYEIGSMKDLMTAIKDKNDNTMLHLAGMKANKRRLDVVSGVALQMQKEILWFKEVETMIPPSYRENKNKDGLTASELFSMEHKDLLTEGERWMKDTASQCMVVAALIATVVFAAAFTVPGGYNQDNRIPVFLRKSSFMVFVLSDVVSLFSSSTSILMFLSILTSRYAEHDFLKSLPNKLMIGLTTLFLSIATMMIAFSASFFVIYKDNFQWTPIVITILAGMPVITYAILQFPLLYDVIRSTRSSRYVFKPKKHMLY